MLAFLRDLFDRPAQARTVILLDAATMSEPRQYEVRPRSLLGLAVAGGVALALLLVALVLFTPLRRAVVGPGPEEMRAVTEANARLVAAFEDSVALQYQQIAQLRAIITGDYDSLSVDPLDLEAPVLPDAAEAEAALGVSGDSAPAGQPADQPALALPWLDPSADGAPAPTAAAEAYLAGLRLPALAPVNGLLSRGYNAATGHFGLDLAADEGSPVRAFGDGYVVFADWTHDGGYVIAVQHGDGYLSVYKHNQRLLKRVGDRVQSRETIALSGNTGVVTTGPHLHFELWRGGLAQDPRAFLVTP